MMTSDRTPYLATVLIAAALTITCRQELRPAGQVLSRAPAAELSASEGFGLFGINNPVEPEHVEQLGEYLRDLNVSFVTHMFSRNSLEPRRGRFPESKWAHNDEYVRQVVDVAGATMIVKIKPETNWETTGVRLQGRKGKARYAPGNWEDYRTYLRRLASRYKGKVRFWMLGNEPNEYFGCPEVFAKFVRVSHEVLTQVDPRATCTLGAPAANNTGKKYTRFYEAVLRDLARDKTSYFIAMDIHRYGFVGGRGRYDDTDTPTISHWQDFRRVLDESGFTGVPLWQCEQATYSGQDLAVYVSTVDKRYELQTEEEQASDVVKRLLYPLTQGVRRTVWSTVIEHRAFKGEEHNRFNTTGLVYNGSDFSKTPTDRGAGVKKLGYHTYKLVARTLSDADPGKVELVETGSKDVRLLKFVLRRGGDVLYVAWWDFFNHRGRRSERCTLDVSALNAKRVRIVEMVPNAKSGADLKAADYPEFFRRWDAEVRAGRIAVTLGKRPVLISAVER